MLSPFYVESLFCFYGTFSEKQNEVSEYFTKLLLRIFLDWNLLFPRIGNSLWVLCFSNNMRKSVPQRSLFSERNTQYYFIVTVWFFYLWTVKWFLRMSNQCSVLSVSWLFKVSILNSGKSFTGRWTGAIVPTWNRFIHKIWSLMRTMV